jgi:ribosome-interacting GTPase 1
MSTNVTVDYAKAQERYLNAKTREEKIAALEEMVRFAPDHKGGENMRKELKQRLAKLRQQKQSKSSRKSLMIPKEGDAQVCIVGMTQSGKSTLLSKLTNARPEISNRQFTTTRPQIGTFEFDGVKIQMIEIPSNFKPMFMSIVQSSDGMILLYRDEEELEELKSILSDYFIRKPCVEIKRGESLEKIKNNTWNMLGLIRIYCKEPGKKPENKALVIKKGSNVEDAAKKIHKDFTKYFRFARIWGSSKYPGEKVGSDYVLRDKDILEIHIG